jgi:hypothetical protein
MLIVAGSFYLCFMLIGADRVVWVAPGEAVWMVPDRIIRPETILSGVAILVGVLIIGVNYLTDKAKKRQLQSEIEARRNARG